MSERFEKLFSLSENLYSNDAPIAILAGVLLKDQKTGAIIAQLKYQNISTKVIKALKISILASDVTGKISCGIQEYQYLDLSIDKGEIFGSNKAIVMTDRNSRKFAIGSVTVMFSDNSIWEGNGEAFCALPPLMRLDEEHDSEIVKQYKLTTTKKAIYVPQDNGSMWICTCGGINEIDTCPQCNCEKQNVFSSYDIPSLTSAMDERLEKERIQNEQEAKKKKAKKTINVIIVSLILLAFLFIIGTSTYFSIKADEKHEEAVELTKAGKYAEAISIFEEIGDTGYEYGLCKDVLDGSFSHIINHYDLETFVIPDGITTISSDAFDGCDKLTSITIPKSVKTIEPDAFDDLLNLTSIYINDVASWCEINFDSAYDNPLRNAENLYLNGKLVTELVIPDGVTSIGAHAFYNCQSLTSITIPDSVTSIGEGAFSGCDNLTAVYIANVENWCKIKFYDSDSNPLYYAKKLYLNGELITELTIPNGVKYIGGFVFGNCDSLISVTVPDSVTSIEKGAFSGCNSLTSITLPFVGEKADGTWKESFGHIFGYQSYYSDINDYVPSSLKTVIITGGTSIGYEAFSGCSNLTSITIPDSVTSIDYSAFSGCSGLTSITIPDSVTSIGQAAFDDCSNLESITVPFVGEKVDGTGTGAFGYIFGNKPHYTSDKKLNAYVPSSLKTVIITGGTSIGGSAFSGCSGLKSITIPDSVTSIGNSAFSDCDSLVYNEYDNAYYLGNDTNPYVVLIKAKTTDITSCQIHEKTKVIYDNAFYDCDSLTSITIPDSVTSIGNYAFNSCYRLTSVTIGNNVTSIGSSAFRYCDSLTSVTIPDSVTSIGDYAFYDCDSLTSITIPDSVTGIGNSAFAWCGSLTTINFTGTEEQWNAIEKGDLYKPSATIVNFNYSE